MKTTRKRIVPALFAPALLFLILSAAPLAGTVSALPEPGRYEQTETPNAEDTAVAVQNDQTADTAEAEPAETEVEQESPRVKSRAAEARAAAKLEIEKQRAARKETKTAAQRKLVCENRKKAINNKLAAFVQATDKHLTRLKDVDAKIRSYQLNNDVSAEGFDALLAAADVKKGAAETAVGALKTVAADVNCDNPETVVALRAVKDTAIDTRRALHEYRTSIKAMVAALVQTEEDKTAESADGSRDTSNDANPGNPADSVPAVPEAN